MRAVTEYRLTSFKATCALSLLILFGGSTTRRYHDLCPHLFLFWQVQMSHQCPEKSAMCTSWAKASFEHGLSAPHTRENLRGASS